MPRNFYAALASLFFLYVGCSNPSYHAYQSSGPEEFIIDSYKIRQGKYSILEMEGKAAPLLPQELLVAHEPLIQNGDVLTIVICHPTREDLVKTFDVIGSKVGFMVDQGQICVPELGSVAVLGLTVEKARAMLQDMFSSMIKDSEVFVNFKKRKEEKVELIGQVMCSSVVINGSTRLFDVLSQARLSQEANLFKSYIARNNQLLPVDFNRLIKDGDMSQNIVMQGGDKIFIADASSSTVMMLGELSQKGLINLPSGFISLREAIARAGGIAFTGDKGFIQVIRGNILKPKIYVLNWKHIIQVPTESMLLMPGDIVYVAATPITEWNRFVSQLFPSFTALDWVGKGAGVGVML
jgi:polysaccharide export outer membrane protein